MTSTARRVLTVAFLALAGCSHFGDRRPRSEAAAPLGWRALVTESDRARLRDWRTSFTNALAKVRAAGQGDRLSAEGALLQPDTALSGPNLPPGDYRCRTFKLGSQIVGGNELVVYPPFTCRVARVGDRLSFAKVGGSQRPVGWLFADSDARMVFLGTILLGDETRAMDYGRDPDRDLIGAVERIGPRRWRIVLPAPRWESLLDVIELVPAG